MKRLSQTLALAALCCLAVEAVAQQGNYVLGLEGWGGYTSNGTVPFWLRSNQYGSVPLDGASLSLIGFTRKDYEAGKEKLFDWGASFEGRANLGQGSNLTLIEGYGKVRMGIFELRAGRSKKITGLCDTTLTSGSWAISGTNLGIPEVELSVRDFWTLPILGELFAFKGNFSHGWLGDLLMIRYLDSDTIITSFLHQKSLYGRFGKPEWKLKFYGGFNHQVVWGNEQAYYNEDYILNPLETYFYVITGKRYYGGHIQAERQGNHLGSIDLGLEYRFDKFKVLLYRQNLYEAGALAHLANIQDGLNGLSIENLQKGAKGGVLKKILIEFLYTKNQAGQQWSLDTSSPYEPYYNHGQYLEGWSFKGNGLGTPFINTREFIRNELATHPDDFFINNRIMVYQLGCEGTVKGIEYLLKTSFSNNYGTYNTTDEEQTTDLPDPGAFGIFGEQKQLSAYIELNKTLPSGWNFGLVGAGDIGKLYYNSFGFFFKASYVFNL